MERDWERYAREDDGEDDRLGNLVEEALAEPMDIDDDEFGWGDGLLPQDLLQPIPEDAADEADLEAMEWMVADVEDEEMMDFMERERLRIARERGIDVEDMFGRFEWGGDGRLYWTDYADTAEWARA